MTAKEREETTEGAGQEQAQKKSPIFLILLVVLALAGAGAGAYFFFFSAPSDEELAKEIAQEKGALTQPRNTPKVGVLMPLEPFVVNLADPRARHFLKASITLELVDDSAKDDADRLLPRIRNDIIMLLTSQTMEDVITLEGKIRLRDQLIARVNRILGQGRVKNVYFAQFVVQ
ncbi:flagellar basal body protein FliL [Dissulfurirhabdus thermomarina]|uniref:Flagellar protein FliL n=1 Tax=Dissulfurirhabdus thermomarina TaxID=1765737 RepID=A0A6N9TW51_DISTH|nr:flagellar basal body-associated FliL family protein [Dissulfurirhabdus thermomarina]NDY42716.1 flagellar basal body protein FliL [Dissulfurirhabdus thermomarina]NMX24469.1 flagellar basal body protein FliL [Dissulfurirhabdus thermomarina]